MLCSDFVIERQYVHNLFADLPRRGLSKTNSYGVLVVGCTSRWHRSKFMSFANNQISRTLLVLNFNERTTSVEPKRVRIGFDLAFAKAHSLQAGRNSIWVDGRYGVPDVNQLHP